MDVRTATKKTGNSLCHDDVVLVDERKKREVAKGQYRETGMVWAASRQEMGCMKEVAHTAEEAAETFW
jgi:hypothetical protein